MTARELVLQTLEFRNKARAPRHLWTLPWAEMYYGEMLEKIKRDFPDDIVNASVPYGQYAKTAGDPYAIGTYTDEWGCVFENRQAGIIGEVKNPIVTEDDWEDFEQKVHIPTEQLTFSSDDVNCFCAGTDKFVLAGCNPRPFEQMQFLRGTEELYVDIALGSEGMKKTLGKLHAFYCELVTKWAETDVDGISFMDDWGTQKSLLINPETWRKLFKPLYKEYIDIAHAHGKKIFMHSDGYTLDIIPDLIELGLDAMNMQVFCMGVEKLEQFAGKITFWGEIDRQWILPGDNRQDAVDAVEKVYHGLWKDGGCIAQCEFGPGARPENVYAVFETWQKLTAGQIPVSGHLRG